MVLVLEWVLVKEWVREWVKEWVKEWVLVLEWVLVMALALIPSACTDICLSNQVHMATRGSHLCIFCSQHL